MQLKDARKLGDAELFEKRKQAVLLYQDGHSMSEVGKIVGVHRNVVGEWMALWRKGGEAGLKPKRRGNPSGKGRKLSPPQEKEVVRLITDRAPDQLKLPFALWTREAVVQLVSERYGIDLALRTVGDYLKRWGMTPQRPVKRAYERSEPAVKRWLEEEYPGIERRAKEQGAEIHWSDETGVKSTDIRGRGFAPKGKTPVVRHKGKAEKVNMISSITNQGKLRFMFYEGRFTQIVFLRFLKRLIKNAKRPLVVIVDNLPVHHGKKVASWLEKNSDRIQLEFLPSYSPDLNPDEYLNCDLKQEIAKRPERRQKGKFRSTATKVMRSLQNQPARVVSYFKADTIKYAA